RPLLNAGDELCGDSVLAQKPDGDGRTLEAQHFFEIEDARDIDGAADRLRLRPICVRSQLQLGDGAMDCGETPAPDKKLHCQQLSIGREKEPDSVPRRPCTRRDHRSAPWPCGFARATSRLSLRSRNDRYSKRPGTPRISPSQRSMQRRK